MSEIMSLYIKLIAKKPPCIFRTLTGLYCPGCGGSRAVYSLILGHPLKSLYYNPSLIYGIVMIIITLYRLFAYRIIKKDFQKPVIIIPLYLGLPILLIANAVIRNILLIFFNISL